MCGRFSLAMEAKLLCEMLGARPAGPETDAWKPSWNIAPSQSAPVLSSAKGGRLSLNPWGARLGGRFVFNVRSETLANPSSPLLKLPLRRCLVPADGFYEWKGSGRAAEPYLLTLQGSPLMLFAAVLLPGEGGFAAALAIVTCEAKEPLSSIHSRSPAPLDGSAAMAWTDPSLGFSAACEAALPARRVSFNMKRVDRRVGSVSFNSPEAWRESDAPEEINLL